MGILEVFPGTCPCGNMVNMGEHVPLIPGRVDASGLSLMTRSDHIRTATI